MQYFDTQRANGGRLIVADPRLTTTAQRADLHLRLTSGMDAALANGIMHILVRVRSDRHGLYRGAHGGDRLSARDGFYILARAGGADHGRVGGESHTGGTHAGRGADGDSADGAGS